MPFDKRGDVWYLWRLYYHYYFVVTILSHHMVRLTRRRCLNVSLSVPDLTKHDVTLQVGPKTLRFCVTWHWIQLTAVIEILKFCQTTCVIGTRRERSSHRVCPYNKRHYPTCNSNAASLKFKLSARPKNDRHTIIAKMAITVLIIQLQNTVGMTEAKVQTLPRVSGGLKHPFKREKGTMGVLLIAQ